MKKGGLLLEIINLSGASLPSIREEVKEMMSEYDLQCGGKPRRYISYGVSSRLIKQRAMKAGAVGGLVATPATIPVIGTIGTLVVSTTVDLAYLLRTQIELCYGISVAYEAIMDEEELKAITLALVGFSGGAQAVKGITSTALRNIVDAMAIRYMKKGITEATVDVAGRIGPRLLGGAYKLIPLVGIPINASINIASTMIVGNRARKYFSAWDTSSDLGIVINEKD